MLAFFPELLDIEEPLLKEDWTQCDEEIFQLPFEGVTKHTHPKVISLYFMNKNFNTSPLYDSQKLFRLLWILKEYKYAVEKLRTAYYSNTTSVEAIKSSNTALMSDLTFNDSILKAVVLQTGVNMNDTDMGKYKKTFLFRFDGSNKKEQFYWVKIFPLKMKCFYRFSVNTELKNFDYLADKQYVGATHGVSNKLKNQIQVWILF